MESRLGDYRLLQKIGEGVAGEVYLATPTVHKLFAKIGDLVAIKLYKSSILEKGGQLARIEREFKVGSNLVHPNLLRIFECHLRGDDRPYLVMEYRDGMPLHEWVRMFYPISDHVLLHVASKIADGMSALHAAKIVHRDLKPENIMISSDFSPKIMDFGVVQIKGDSGQTPSGSFLGTIRNSAPEWVRCEAANDDPRMDIYSFGTVLYCLLHGEQVFHEEKQFARLIELVTTEVPDFDSSLTGVKGRLADLSQQLLSKSPDERLQTAVEITESIEDICSTVASTDVVPLHGYVASALTGLSSDARGSIMFMSNQIADTFKKYEIYLYQPRKATDPLLHQDVPAETVYALDRKRVLSADVLVLIGDHPSFGVGQEVEIASAFGIPAILVKREGVTISRMVTGGFLNLIDDVTYTSPEDLGRKLRRVLQSNIELLRTYKAAVRPSLPDNIGDAFRRLRERANLSLEHAARCARVSIRLLRTLEASPLGYHNVGLHLLGRLLATYGATMSELVGTETVGDAPRRSDSNNNLRKLEDLAGRLGWPAADLLKLRDDYLREVAARGRDSRITEGDWVRRHAALEQHRLRERSPIDGEDGSGLFDTDAP